MGTRGIFAFRYKGKLYCVFNRIDSHFEGLGDALVQELKSAGNNLSPMLSFFRRRFALVPTSSSSSFELSDNATESTKEE